MITIEFENAETEDITPLHMDRALTHLNNFEAPLISDGWYKVSFEEGWFYDKLVSAVFVALRSGGITFVGLKFISAMAQYWYEIESVTVESIPKVDSTGN